MSQYCGFCDYGFGDANECECSEFCGNPQCSGDIADEDLEREELQEC